MIGRTRSPGADIVVRTAVANESPPLSLRYTSPLLARHAPALSLNFTDRKPITSNNFLSHIPFHLLSLCRIAYFFPPCCALHMTAICTNPTNVICVLTLIDRCRSDMWGGGSYLTQ